MSGVAIAAGVGVAISAYGVYSQKKASDKAAAIDDSSAQLNARFDIAQAEQLDEDSKANIALLRENGKIYLSKQDASYASAGVLSTSGSPLAAQIINAGRIEQQAQQAYRDNLARRENLYAKARAGILEGNALASADRAQGTAALINGGANLARQAFTAYQSGTFG